MDGVLSQEEISALLAKDQGSADKSTDSKSLDFFSLKTKKTAVFPYIFRKSCCIFLSVSLTFMQSASYQTGCCKDLRRSLSLQAALHGCPAR